MGIAAIVNRRKAMRTWRTFVAPSNNQAPMAKGMEERASRRKMERSTFMIWGCPVAGMMARGRSLFHFGGMSSCGGIARGRAGVLG